MNTKKFFVLWTLTVLLFSLATLTGCGIIGEAITGSGDTADLEYDFIDFNEVALSHAFEATITQGDEFRVVVTADDNLVDRLVVEQEGNRVNIGLEQGTMVSRATLAADITMPTLTRLETSGASSAQLTGFSSAENFTAESSGAGRIHGDIVAGDLDLEASGASTISLAGTAGDVRANASGASTIDLEELTAADVDAIASGGSNVTVNTGGRLNADASGASNIYYLGNPTLGDVKTSGASDVGPR